MNKISLLILPLLIFSIQAFAKTTDAATILNNATNKFSSCKSISATFSIIDNGHSDSGSIIVAGNKFVVSTSLITTWFNGKTQWSYSKDINEVNITEPTPIELQQINPFSIISNFRSTYNAKGINSPKGTYKIVLSPKKSNQTIKSIELTLNSSTYFPSLIVINTSNSKATIKIKSITEGKQLPSSTFIFDTKKYPRVEIIDLR